MTVQYQIQVLRLSDADLLLNAAPEVFDHTLDSQLVEEFLTDPRHHIVVALDSGMVVGFVSAVHYVHPDKPAELWINEVSVAPQHRQQRLGRRLLEATLAVGRDLGCTTAWVLTDESNGAAMRLYQSAGGAAAGPSIMFEFAL